MLYLLYCRDRDDAEGVRAATRAAHLEYVGATTSLTVRVAGPILADDGETMIGSLFLLEADDAGTVRAFNADDPYTKAGLFGSVEIHPFRYLAGDGALPKG
jgi:uncharacterized protein YciI